MPSQLKQEIPWFSFCQNIFTAYDPPTALRSAPALAPAITPDSDPRTQKQTAAPSHAVSLGAGKIATSKVSTSGPEFPTGNDPGQKAAGASKISTPETGTLAETSEDTTSASKGPNQLPQGIPTSIAGHSTTAHPTAVAIAVIL